MVVLTPEQLEDRLAALHRASLELVGDLSLETLLERIVQLARDQVNARYAALGVVDEEGNLTKFIPIGMEKSEVEKMAHPPVGKGLLGLFKKERRTIRVANICTDERRVGFPANHPPMRSFLGVPILLGSRWMGQIYLTDKQGHPEFTQQDERVIETLAAYAAVAISNARLYENLLARDAELVQRNEDLALLNDIATALARAPDIDTILDQTLAHVMTYLDVEAGEIFLREEGDDELRLAVHRGESPEAFWTRDRFLIGEGFIGIAAEGKKPMVNLDPRYDVRFLRPAVLQAGYQCIALIPMLASGNVIGVMGVATRQERRLDEREVQIMSAIASWAALSLENVRLNRQGRRLAVLEERERIGMDLHDGIIQSIYGVGLALDYARMALDDDPKMTRAKIEQSIEALNATIRDIRTYILDLRPRQFQGQDLNEGLQRLIDEFQANSGISATLDGPENDLVDFPQQNAVALFHICQESLANIAKHSAASEARVQIWTSRDRVLMEVADNGRGFDLRKMSVTLGHGLSNVHVRARKVGGDVEITSAPGEGTTVLAYVPRRGSPPPTT
jgi:two-component system, NarL family, sensor histidine kinase DevS